MVKVMFNKKVRLLDLLSDPQPNHATLCADKKNDYYSQIKLNDIQLIHFLAEYGHIYLRNIANIHPYADRHPEHLDVLEYQNLICRAGNMLYLGEEGVKLCKDRCAKRFVPSGGDPVTDIRKNAISKIASEFAREGFTVSEHEPSDYMFLQAKVVKEAGYGLPRNSIALGLALGKEMRAGVFYEDLSRLADQRKQAVILHKIGITTMIVLTKKCYRKKKIDTARGKTQVYYIPRNKKGYEKIKNIISSNSIIPVSLKGGSPDG